EDQGNVGPDFQFGYGRVNIQNTVDIIRLDNGAYDLIREDTLSPAETWEYDISVVPGDDLKVTLVWDDFEGDYGAGGLMLVNDLDLELEAPGGGIHYPWVLNPGHPSWAATTGDDHLNNVEQVEVISPASGTWTIRVTATIMPEANQDFSVVTNFAGGAPDLPPDAPTGLGAVPGSGEGEIDVSWNANSEPDLDHYRLERASNPGFSGATSFTTTNTHYDDSGLVPSDTYYYRVFAVGAGTNESDPSSTASSDAQDLPPSAPTGLSVVTGTGEGEIDITWNASTEPDFDHYRLERDDSPSFSSPTSFTTTNNHYNDSGLVPGDRYYYRVYGVDEGSNESASSSVDSALAQDLPPAPPTGLVAVTGTNEGEIFISWNPNSEPDLDRYRVERSLAPDFEPGSEPFEEPAVSFTDTGLIPGETYYYRVIAIDTAGNESGYSNVDFAVALDLAPSPPTGLIATPGTNEGEIDVVWDPNSEPDFDHYRLERHTDPGFGPGSDPFDWTLTVFPDSGLVPGETYYYRVIAVDVNGNESDPSNVDSAVATDLPPAPPTGLVAVTGTAEGEIEISWNPNSE
ncbi:fibronectin type III domain-containing protein, partial [bacterium]|nr:fibronectin type III domain-containing protein [bacterium]